MSCSLCLIAALLRRQVASISKSMGTIVDLPRIKTQGYTRVIYGEGKNGERGVVRERMAKGKRRGERKNGQQ